MKLSILVSLLLIGSATANTPLYSNNTIPTIDTDNNIYSELGFSVENIRVDPILAIKPDQYDVSTSSTVLTAYTSDYVPSTNTVQNVTTVLTSESPKSTANSTVNVFNLPVISNISDTEYVNPISNTSNISSEYISNTTSLLQDDNGYSTFTSTARAIASPTTISITSNNTILDRKYPNITSTSIVRGINPSVISSTQNNSNSLQASNISSISPWTNNTNSRNTSDHLTSVTSTTPFSTINTSSSINVQFKNSSTSVDVTSNTSFYQPSVTGFAQLVNSSTTLNTTRTSSSRAGLSYDPNYSNFTLPNKELNQTMTNILAPISTPHGSGTQILQNSSISSTKLPIYNLSTASIKGSLCTDPTSSVKLSNNTSITNSSSRTITFTEENYTTIAYHNQTTTRVKINNVSVNNTYVTQGNRSTIIASITTTGIPSSLSSSIHSFTNSTVISHSSQPNINISSSSISITGKNDAAVPTGNIKQPSSALVNSSTSIQKTLTSSSTIEILTQTPFTQINSTQSSTTRINTLSAVESSLAGIYINSSFSQASSISSPNEIITTGGNKAIDPTSATLLSFSNVSENSTSIYTGSSSIRSIADPSSSSDVAIATKTQVSISSLLPKPSLITKKNNMDPTATLISESHSLNTNTARSPIVTSFSQVTNSNDVTIQTTDGNSSEHTHSTFGYDIDPTIPVVNNTSSYHKTLRQSSELSNSVTYMKPSTTVKLITTNNAAELQPSSKSVLTNSQSIDFNKLVTSSSTVDVISKKITGNDKSTSTNVVATTKDFQLNEETTKSDSALSDTHTAMQNDSHVVTSTTSVSKIHTITATNIKETVEVMSVISSSSCSETLRNVGTNGSNDVNVNNISPASVIESSRDNVSTATATTQKIESSITIASEMATATVFTGPFTTASTLIRSSISASSTHSAIEYSDSASSFSTHSWLTVIFFIVSYTII
ncbi:hypothetical protein C6P45_001071 [Maudiozyma exigua]|uniref:Uncharacterized protein n=1 Tax=Maudiozyma exigua TaxID=34358 RepID=A0A9P7B783_MAUEX|nr:hypothetical protein C6P45_001071 [Kazachstania exigua]